MIGGLYLGQGYLGSGPAPVPRVHAILALTALGVRILELDIYQQRDTIELTARGTREIERVVYGVRTMSMTARGVRIVDGVVRMLPTEQD